MSRSVAIALLLAGCGGAAQDIAEIDDEAGAPAPETVEVTVSPRDPTSDVRARASGMTVWLDPTARPVTRDGRRAWQIKGRASRNLDAAFSWIPDDPFGEARLLSARTFEVLLRDPSEQSTLFSGSPIFLRLTAAAGSPRDYQARITLAPWTNRWAGARDVRIDRVIRPVFVLDGRSSLRFRATIDAPDATCSLRALAAGDRAPVVSKAGGRSWSADWTFEGLAAAADPPESSVGFEAICRGRRYPKSAGIDLAVSALGLTVLDPTVVWPAATCARTTSRCLDRLDVEEVDFASCGDYRPVAVCWSARAVGLREAGTTCAGASECQRGVCWDADAAGSACEGRVCSAACNGPEECVALASSAGLASPESAVCTGGLCDLSGTSAPGLSCQ